MSNLKILGNHDENTINQIYTCMKYDFAVRGLLCADGHLGYGQPIGGVVAYEDHVSISGVGFDIGCGNKAVRTNINFDDINREYLTNLARLIQSNISFGIGRINEEKVEHPLFEKGSHPAWDLPHISELKRKAQDQLGTVGSGNHYIDIFRSEKDNQLWIGVHFGSRGLGHSITKHYLQKLNAKDGMEVEPCIIDVNTELGREYLMALDLGGEYAYAGRDWVCNKVLQLMGASETDSIHNHHNFAWLETVDNKPCYVARKGSTPLFPNQRSFVGGSMGDISVIIKGLDSQPVELINSTVHGSGRLMSRAKAAGKVKWINGKKTNLGGGCVDETAWREKLANDGLILKGAGADEMPEVYRPLREVLSYHTDNLVVEEVLQPIIVVMAGDEFDPYHD